jgi:IS605 OrfB family transposase
MVQYQLKLGLNTKQEAVLNEWLWNLTGVWNWAIRKIELDAGKGVYYSKFDFQDLVAGHGKKIDIPTHVLRGMLSMAHTSWQRCFKKIAKKPRLKGLRNQLNSIPFPDTIKDPKDNHIKVPGIGSVKFHAMNLPEGRIKCGRIIRKASGWYFCLFIDAEPKAIPHTGDGEVGIDPGFMSLLTLSTGEKIEHPKEFVKSAKKLAQMQKGRHKKLTARIHERTANKRRDRNHKLSRRLVAENKVIVFSADNHKGISKKFGKSVTSAGHAQLQSMLNYKCIASGREYIEVNPKGSTMTCSTCGKVSGPKGLAGLSVRQWSCSECGSLHDRDTNAAINTLIAGAGIALERAYSAHQESSGFSEEIQFSREEIQ